MDRITAKEIFDKSDNINDILDAAEVLEKELVEDLKKEFRKKYPLSDYKLDGLNSAELEELVENGDDGAPSSWSLKH